MSQQTTAGTPIDPEVLPPMTPARDNHFGNGITCNTSTFFRHPCFWIMVGVVGTVGVQVLLEHNRSKR